MQQTVSTYNPEAVQVVIDGVLIVGLAEDGVTVEHEASSEITEGMDSGMTFNYNASRMAKVTISLRAASAGAKALEQIRAAFESQLRAGSGAPTVAGSVRDPVNGSGITAPQCFFLNKPLPSYGTEAGNVEFELAFCNYDSQTATLVTP